MPDPSTLIYARKRFGDEVVEQLNEALLHKLKEKAVLKHRKLRTDTTVVESDIHQTHRRNLAAGWRQSHHPAWFGRL